jgi:dTDP-3-amino-2,3,6-trideoxy-4-keto-D-glucose/dTDP-3-amino-3,4,6-trideoxy-alpha-D-glucose/dTDP-2,6-dideoxy-D-kanosamine transaminase
VTVPFVDLGTQNRGIWPAASERIAGLVEGGSFILGEEVEEFERRFASFCGTRHAVGVSSGTSALTLTLRAIGVGPGDEVITVSNSFVATVAAIALVGAEAVLVDVGEDETIDPGAIRAALSPRTRAVLPVHLRGRPAAIEAVLAIAEEVGIAVIEDCAQAIGSRVGAHHVGSFGAAGCFSLHPLKNLSAWGDAGVVVSDDDELAAELRQLRNHGLRGRDAVERWGENARLDPVQAAVLNVKIGRLEEWNRRRRELAATYRAQLAGEPLELPADHPGHTYHHFVVRSDGRDALRDALAADGIETRVHYPVPVHLQPAARAHCRPGGPLERTERDAGRILSLPLHPDLPDDAVGRVAAGLRAALADA